MRKEPKMSVAMPSRSNAKNREAHSSFTQLKR